MNKRTSIVGLFLLMTQVFGIAYGAGEALPAGAKVPRIEGKRWLLCGPAPITRDGEPVEMSKYDPSQKGLRTVDFTLWQDEDNLWHVWHNTLTSIPRKGSKYEKKIIFYHQTGTGLHATPWSPRGIALESEERYGEGGFVTSPYLYKEHGKYYMFYGAGGIRMMVSSNGKDFVKKDLRGEKEYNLAFGSAKGMPNGFIRDQKVIKVGKTYYIYYCACGDKHKGGSIPTAVLCRSASSILGPWSAPKIVAWGGAAGYGQGSAECPNVVHFEGNYYLLRSGDNSRTYVYCSPDPWDFGLDSDRYFTGTILDGDAIEVLEHEGKWYIASLKNHGGRGIEIARLKWVPKPPETTADVASVDAVVAVEEAEKLVPKIDGPWWQVAGQPDLGEYTSERQQPVDFTIWQAQDGSWHLWSCVRYTNFTKVAGPKRSRVLYHWRGKNLTDTDWKGMGIAWEGDPKVGETRGAVGAPHVVAVDDKYYMFYHSNYKPGIHRFYGKISQDGLDFIRRRRSDGSASFCGGPHNRDAMLIEIDGLWHLYCAGVKDDFGVVYCRTSKDLDKWSEAKVVAHGGQAGGTGALSVECPHVIRHKGYFYLFRTQRYGGKREPRTTVYRSKNPLDFGLGKDETTYVCTLPIAAPEIITHKNQLYIAALNRNIDGIRVAKLRFVAPE